MNTKERILQESLTLFSIRGYEAVSMREIGRSVGIKESSIYKHYSGKQAILDAIISMAKTEINEMYIDLSVPNADNNNTIKNYLNMEIEDIARLCTDMTVSQINNEIVLKFRRLLTIEQFRNPELQDIFIELFIDRPMMYQEKVFEFLLESGVLKGGTANMMAMEFFSPFFMMQYKLQNSHEQMIKVLQEHTISFIKKYL